MAVERWMSLGEPDLHGPIDLVDSSSSTCFTFNFLLMLHTASAVQPAKDRRNRYIGSDFSSHNAPTDRARELFKPYKEIIFGFELHDF